MRRLTLAPGALSPESAGEADDPGGDPPPLSAPLRGSRFSALVEGEGEDVEDAGEMALQVAKAVFLEDRRVSDDNVQRPFKTGDEVAAEFWDGLGFPTPESRFWEKATSASSSSGNEGTESAFSCRSELSSERRRVVPSERVQVAA